ncbi:efflux transporter outer membrane subunit [Thalassotalea sp. LPB0316]|uniref:efflux transporter outer membrane subunit n=1 Tax=Thalassotalea sp. LPB0316 TaxID=2769490 RepID=UPI001867457C|nr:efflux transporter outer membrane subunit [Thalassotalea sp. LPB0316]QOL26322.1 efflux transporter outer membrane subunit [Thalassotalea sp. LPB0316]
MKLSRQLAPAFITSVLLIGCATQSPLDEQAILEHAPNQWQQAKQDRELNTQWLATASSPQLAALVEQALSSNRQLKQQALDLAIQAEQVNINDAALWPEIDFSLTSSRQSSGEPRRYSNTNNVAIDVSYEIDIWGKLSDSAKQSHLLYLSTKANYQAARNQLITDVINSYFALISAQRLKALVEQRVALSKENLDIILSGYKQGLNEALDVYLARNDLNAELSSLAAQEAQLQQASATLEYLVGDYPSGLLAASGELPAVLDNILLGVPSELIKQKPVLQANWYQLLAQDAALAFAHKQRFPSIRISGSYGSQANQLDDLLSGSSVAWSLLGGLTMPLFNAGELKSIEQQQRLKLQQQEQAYIDSVYQAFLDVERGINLESSLQEQYQRTLAAQENAVIAQTLAFEQYQNGLVSYTTVLDAQERAFNAQSNVISLKNQLITNRVNLYVALGGDYSQGLLLQERLTNDE